MTVDAWWANVWVAVIGGAILLVSTNIVTWIIASRKRIEWSLVKQTDTEWVLQRQGRRVAYAATCRSIKRPVASPAGFAKQHWAYPLDMLPGGRIEVVNIERGDVLQIDWVDRVRRRARIVLRDQAAELQVTRPQTNVVAPTKIL